MIAKEALIKFVCSTLFSTLISLIVVLAVIHYSPISSILASHSQYVPVKDFKYLDEYEQILVERMIREKSIVSVDDLWTMQVSFHQTVISLLIALNAAILGIAFFIIRSSSREEVVKASIEQFNQFSCSSAFTKLVQKKSKKELLKINSTYEDAFDFIEDLQDKVKPVEELQSKVEMIEESILKISERVATLDNSEEKENKSLRITE